MHDGFKFLAGEFALATGVRSVPDIHWDYAAKKINERRNRYSNKVKNVNFIFVPTKVTALHNYYIEYFPREIIVSWLDIFISKILKLNPLFNFYYNPALISNKDFFFKNDSHWNCLGAINYLKPWIQAEFDVSDKYFLELLKIKSKCFGNILTGEERVKNVEYYDFFQDKNFKILLNIRENSVPDFSIVKTKNDHAFIDERVLVIHSSSYEFSRGFLSPVFKETVEVFAPYVSDEVVSKGDFDRVIIMIAERNSAVVYDGGGVTESILNSLKQDYIYNIIKNIENLHLSDAVEYKDLSFLQALAASWSGK